IIGPAPTVAPASTARFFLSSDASLDGTDVLLGSRAVGTLTAGALYNAGTVVTIPANTSAGSYFIIAAADALNQVTEHDDTNNVGASDAISVAAPDLIVAAVTATPSPVSTGGTLTIFNSIRNIGPSPTVAAASTARFFLSTDGTVGGIVSLLGSRAVGTLTA